MDERKPLDEGWRLVLSQKHENLYNAYALEIASVSPGRGLHSSTFRLNVSAFYGMGGAFRGCGGGVQEVAGGVRGCVRCIVCQKRLRLS